MQTLKAELFYAIVKFLEEESCIEAAELVRKFIDDKNILPKRINTIGRVFNNDFKSFDNIYYQKDPRLLFKYYEILVDFLKKYEWNVEGSNSLLGITSRIDRFLPKQTFMTESLSGVIRPKCSHPFQDICDRLHCQMDLVRHNLAHRNAIYCVQFDQRGEYVFTGSDDCTIKIWSLQTTSDTMPCTIRHVLRGHVAEIIELALSPDNHLLASVDSSSCLIIWCLRTGQPILSLRGSPVNRIPSGLCFLPVHTVQGADHAEDDGQLSQERISSDSATLATPSGWLAVTSFGGFLHLIPYQHHVRSAVGSTRNIDRWSCCSLNVLPTVRFTTAPADTPTAFWPSITCMDVSPGCALIATGCSDQRVRLYHFSNPTRPELAAVLDAHEECVNSVAFSHSGLKLATGSSDGGSCWLWRLQTGQWRRMPLTCRKRIKCRPCLLTWSKHDRYLIASMKNGSVYVYFGDSGRLATVIEGHEGAIHAVTPSPFDDNIVATAGVDGRFQIWNIERHRNYAAQPNHHHQPTSNLGAGCSEPQPDRTPLLYHYRYPPGRFQSSQGFVWLPSDPGTHDQPVWAGARRSARDVLSVGAAPRDRAPVAQDPGGGGGGGNETHQSQSASGSQWNQRITACRALPVADGIGFLLVTKNGLMSLFRPAVRACTGDEERSVCMDPGYVSNLTNLADKNKVSEQFFHWELDTAEWRQTPVDEGDQVAMQRFHETASILGSHAASQAAGAYCRVRGGQRTSRFVGVNGRQTSLSGRNDIAEDGATGAAAAAAASGTVPVTTSVVPGGYQPPPTVLFEIVHDPSGVPFHRLPPPYLTNFIGVPLPAEFQLQVPGRSCWEHPLDLVPSLTIDEDGVDIVIDDIQFRTDVPSDYCPPVRASTVRPIAGKTYLWQSVWLDGRASLIEPLSPAEFAVHLERSRSLYEEEVQFYLSQGDAIACFAEETGAVERPYLSLQPTRNAFGSADANHSSLAAPGALSSLDANCSASTDAPTASMQVAVNTVHADAEQPGPSFLHTFLAKRFKSRTDANNRTPVEDNCGSSCNGINNHQSHSNNSNIALTCSSEINHTVSVDEPPRGVDELDDAEDEDLDDDASEESEWSEHIDVDIGWWHRQRRRNRPRRAAAQDAQDQLRAGDEPSDAGNDRSHHSVRRTGSGRSRVRPPRHPNTSHLHRHHRHHRRRSSAVVDPCRRSLRQQRRLMLRRRMLREMRVAEARAERESQQQLRRSQRRHCRGRRSSRSSLPADGTPDGLDLNRTGVAVPAEFQPQHQPEEDPVSARRERLKRRLIRSMDYALFTSSSVPLSSVPPEGYLGPDCEGCVYPAFSSQSADPVDWPGPHFDWLSTLHPTATPYVPQLGDRLVYIVRGHKDYLAQAWQNCELPVLTRAGEQDDGIPGNATDHVSTLPWIAWPEIPAYTCGVVTEIRYDTVRTITDDSTGRVPTGTHRGSRAGAAWRRRGSRSGVKHARTSSKRLPTTSAPESGHVHPSSSSSVPTVTYSGDSFVRLVTLRIRPDPHEQPYAHLARVQTDASSTGCSVASCTSTVPTHIDVTYHDVDGVLDFLILRHLFDAAVRRPWRPGDLFICPVGDVWWTGRVLQSPSNFLVNSRLSCEPSTSATPLPREDVSDPWLACLIRWFEDGQLATSTDTAARLSELPGLFAASDPGNSGCGGLPENVDRLSPWDMHLPCARSLAPDDARCYPSQTQIRCTYGVGPPSPSPPPVDQKTKDDRVSGEPEIAWSSHAQSLLECFREIMKLPVSELFNQPVDLVSYPDYLFVNPYPVDLTLIVARLSTGFYRQAAAVRSDLQHLLDNAVRYNRPDSAVVQHAHLVFQLARRALDDARFESSRIPQEYERLITSESEPETSRPNALSGRNTRISGSPRAELENRCTSVGASEGNSPYVETRVYSNASRGVRHTPRKMPDSARGTTSDAKSNRSDQNNEVSVELADADRTDACHCSLAPGQWVPRCAALVRRLCAHDRSLFFREPIDTQLYPDYLDIVSVPMDLSTVQKRLRNTLDSVQPRFHELRARPGLRHRRRRRPWIYACPHAFLRDMHRIVRNSKQYNDDPETVVYEDTCWLENWIERVLITSLQRFRLLAAPASSDPNEVVDPSGSHDPPQSTWPTSGRRGAGRPSRFLQRSRLASGCSAGVRRLCKRPSHRTVVHRGRPRVKRSLSAADDATEFRPGLEFPRRTSSGRVVRPPLRNSGTIPYTSSISSASDEDEDCAHRTTKGGRVSGAVGRMRAARAVPDQATRSDAVRRSKRRRRSNAHRWSAFVITDPASYAADGDVLESSDE